MEIPPRAQQIIIALYERFQALAHGDDDARRRLTTTIAEQCAFELGPQWGVKRATPSRPVSKDVIAFNGPAGLVGWDWQNGATREPLIPPTFHELASQVFQPVTPANHLDAPPPAPAPPPSPTGHTPLDELMLFIGANMESFDRIADGLEGIAEALRAQTAKLEELRAEGVRLRLR